MGLVTTAISRPLVRNHSLLRILKLHLKKFNLEIDILQRKGVDEQQMGNMIKK